jgi:hypothetical protein
MTTNSSGDQRRFVVLLSVLALVGTVFLGRMVFGGDGGGDGMPSGERLAARAVSRTENAAAPRRAKRAARAAQTGDDLGPSDEFEVFATRDPFEPPFNPTPTEPTFPTTTPPTGGGSVTPPPTATTSPPVTQPPSFNPGTGESIAVLDVFTGTDGTPQARVRVGSTVYTVGVGDTFATSYQVVSLNEPCGQFLFGDSPFQLCEGEETIK